MEALTIKIADILSDLENKADKEHTHVIDDVDELASTLETKADLVSGKVPAEQLPSYVDDVLEFDNKEEFPTEGESGKIYMAKDTNRIYRFTGESYVDISMENSGNFVDINTEDQQINSSKIFNKNIKFKNGESFYVDENGDLHFSGDIYIDGNITIMKKAFAINL